MHKNILIAVGITVLFLGIVVTPMTLGYDVEIDIISDNPPMDSAWPMKCHDTKHTGRSSYSTADNPYDEKWRFETDGWIDDSPIIDNDGTIYFGGCYGGLPYYLYAVYPDGTEKWKYKTGGLISGSSPAISDDGTIYVGSWDDYLYAINPDGTLKWKFYAYATVSSSPCIADDGTIYIGSMGPGSIGRVCAVNPDGTEKWHYDTGYWITSDPAIADDGTVYIGSQDSYLYALWPNGTLFWRFKTGKSIMGPPSIADDGTVYIGSWDDYLYALNPDGSMKWSHQIGEGSAINPSIANDGTIYIGYKKLYAIYPNGTRKWTFSLGAERHIQGSSPAISADGTIYIGTEIGNMAGGEIIAVNPDGTERWRKKIANDWTSSSPSIAEDGTIYIGSAHDIENGYLYAFSVGELEANVNGPYYGLINQPMQFNGSATGGYRPYSYHWDFGDTNSSDEQNPTHIYTDVGVYDVVLTVTDNESNTAVDTTFAWIQETNGPPDKPDIDGPTSVKVGQSYDYSFNATDRDGNDIWYHIGWGDKEIIYIYGPYHSGEELTLTYIWTDKGTYTINCWARDVYDEVSDTATLEVEIPRSRATPYLWYQWFLDRHPMLERLLYLLIA